MRYFILILFLFQSVIILSEDKNTIEKGKMKSGSVWKFEQDLSKNSYLDGVYKKIYYLTLFLDGSYHQYVQIIPANPKNYYGVRYYELDGKWTYKENKLFLVENNKKYSIDYEYFNSNFQNIDNIIIYNSH